MGTYIHQVFEERKPATIREVREAVIEAGKKRVRPAMMTAAVAIIALLPVLTSTGKGADIMVPMAIPTFGGMIIQIMTMFVVPVLQSIWREGTVRRKEKRLALITGTERRTIMNSARYNVSSIKAQGELPFCRIVFSLLLLIASFSVKAQDSLSIYLELADKHNPGLQAKYLEYSAALEKVPQAGALPDPSAELGFYLKPMELTGGNQVSSIADAEFHGSEP
jgi:Cu(I)/Ag(I) efflux system membrane protein CusA/SilA